MNSGSNYLSYINGDIQALVEKTAAEIMAVDFIVEINDEEPKSTY